LDKNIKPPIYTQAGFHDILSTNTLIECTKELQRSWSEV